MKDKSKLKICYWCGDSATGYEHIPPQNLFPKGYRNDLITLGACQIHNEDFSKLDERMRFHMTALGDADIARKHFEDKTLRGLQRKEGRGLATDLINNHINDEESGGMQRESSRHYNHYFEKIIRGLCFYHTGLHVQGSTSFFSNKLELLSMSANAHFYFHVLEKDLSDKWVEGNPKNKDIFDYKYFYSDSEARFFTIMKFYKVHHIIGVTLPKDKTIDDYGLSFEEYGNRLGK